MRSEQPVPFCTALVAGDLVDPETLRRRLKEVDDIDEERLARVAGLLERFYG